MMAQERSRLFLLCGAGLFLGTLSLFGLFFIVEIVHPERFTQGASVIGVGAAVPPNEYNVLAEELRRKEAELAEREAALRGETRPDASDERKHDPLLAISLAATLILFALLLLNFYLDWRRERMTKMFPPHFGIHAGELQTRL